MLSHSDIDRSPTAVLAKLELAARYSGGSVWPNALASVTRIGRSACKFIGARGRCNAILIATSFPCVRFLVVSPSSANVILGPPSTTLHTRGRQQRVLSWTDQLSFRRCSRSYTRDSRVLSDIASVVLRARYKRRRRRITRVMNNCSPGRGKSYGGSVYCARRVPSNSE